MKIIMKNHFWFYLCQTHNLVSIAENSFTDIYYAHFSLDACQQKLDCLILYFLAVAIFQHLFFHFKGFIYLLRLIFKFAYFICLTR